MCQSIALSDLVATSFEITIQLSEFVTRYGEEICVAGELRCFCDNHGQIDLSRLAMLDEIVSEIVARALIG